jgi:hypothetical protein
VPNDNPPPPPRSLGMWIKLFIVWTAGLVMWTIYIVAMIYLLAHC